MSDTSGNYPGNGTVRSFRNVSILWFGAFSIISSAIAFSAMEGEIPYPVLETWLRWSLALASVALVSSTVSALMIILPIRRERIAAMDSGRRILAFYRTAEEVDVIQSWMVAALVVGLNLLLAQAFAGNFAAIPTG